MVNVVICPGQGAQKVGMGKDLADAFPAAREVFQRIDDALSVPLSRLMWEGPEDELLQTQNAQPAILAHSAAVLAVLAEQLGEVVAAAGHSLGEYSAYVAAGAISAEAGARLVRRRGELMREAGLARPGAMAAVLGLATEAVETACAESSTDSSVVVAANLNSPDQTVISGDPEAVAVAGEACRVLGARRVIALKVSGAFHSPLMAPAREGLAGALATASFEAPEVPVIANATAEAVRHAEDAKALLVEQLTAPVRWVESMRTAARLAPAARFVEIGPGAVLSGLVRKILPDATTAAVGSVADVERFFSTA